MDLDLTIRYLDDLTALGVTVPKAATDARAIYDAALAVAGVNPLSTLHAALEAGELTPGNVGERVQAAAFDLTAQRNALEIVRNLPVMGDAGGGWASHAEVRFHDVRVPAENRLGAEGAGFALAQERLGPGRIHHCMRWIGICERAFDLMCRRAASRELAPGRPLGLSDQVQAWVAESRAEIDAARLYVMDTARRIDRDGAGAARDAISAIKFFVAGVLGRVLDRAVQVHGHADRARP